MEKLTRENLYSLEKYAEIRSQFRAQIMAHKKERKVPIGPHATLYFEDRLTIQYQIQEIRKREQMLGLPKKKLVETGYYRLERIHDAYRKYSVKETSSNDRKTILIAPSWGPSNVIESYGDELSDMLLNAGYNVIVRPHPETARRSRKLLNKLKNKYGNNEAFKLELSISSDDSVLGADLLICDCSGIALEYALGTERPVLFLDTPIKIKNDNYAELRIKPFELSIRSEIGNVLSPEKLGEVPSVIAEMITDTSGYKQRLSELREKHIFSFGESSKISSEHIIKLADARIESYQERSV